MEKGTIYTKEELIEKVKNELPQFYNACLNKNALEVVFHQDAFATPPTVREIELLGAGIKVAGYFNKNVTIIV